LNLKKKMEVLEKEVQPEKKSYKRQEQIHEPECFFVTDILEN